MVRSEMFSLHCLFVLVMVSVIFYVVPVPAQADSNFVVYATGPYEIWGGNISCPDYMDYYNPPNCGYVFLGQATTTNSFSGSYRNYVIATYSYISLDSVKMPDGWFMGDINNKHKNFLGNVYKTFRFNSTGKLIGTINDYRISSINDYKFSGPPDGMTNSVGLPPGHSSSYPYTGVFAVYQPYPKAIFKSLNKEEESYVDYPHTANGLPRPHMAGGLIRFNASGSYDPDAPAGSLNRGITEYRWEFGDGTTAIRTDPIYDKIFYDPEIYVVNLTVIGSTGLSSEPYFGKKDSEIIDLSLEPGDLIFLRSDWKTWAFNLIKAKYIHVGMYVGKFNGIHYMIETTVSPPPTSTKKGVQLTKFPRWSYLYEKYADAVRVNVPDPDIRKRAVAFALSKSIGTVIHGYDLDSIFENAKQLDEKDAFEQAKVRLPYYGTDPSIAGKRYYCSELIWAAYYRASNGTIDLSATYGPGAIPPDGIFKSEYIANISSHHEHYPE